MSAQSYPTFLDDPRMIEIVDIARVMEISLLQEMTEGGCKATAFYQYEDRREILAECEGQDMFWATYAAVDKAISQIQENDDD